MDAVFTTCPGCFWATMRGTKASTPWMTPQRLTPIAHSQSLWVTASSPPQRATPALLQTTWTAPNSVNARSASGMHVGEPADVGLDRQAAASGLGHAGHRLGHPGLVEVGDHDVGAFAGEEQRERASDSAGAAGDHRRAALQAGERHGAECRAALRSLSTTSLLDGASGGRLGARSRAARRGCRTRSGSIWP